MAVRSSRRAFGGTFGRKAIGKRMSNGPRKAKVAGGAFVLEQMFRNTSPISRGEAKRTLSEVIQEYPGDAHRLWWKWISETAITHEVRTQTLDCTPADCFSIARDGGQFILYAESPEPCWLGVNGVKGRRIEITYAGEREELRLVKPNRLRRLLARFAQEGRLRCVIIQPPGTNISSPSSKETLSPFERLRQLLRPEWSDIWIVIVYAFVVALLALATPLAVEALVNTVAFGRFLQPVLILALFLFMFLGFQGAIRALQIFVVEIVQRRLFARVAGDLAYRLPRTSNETTDQTYLPELVNRFFDIVTVQKVSAQLLVDGIGLLLSTAIGMAVLGFYHPWLLGFDVLLLVSIALIIFVLGRGAVSSAVYESKSKYYMAAWLEDIARCPTSFRHAGGPEFAMERADRLIHRYLTARKSHFRIVMRQMIFALGLQAVASTLLLGLGGWLVISAELTLGQLVAAELIVTTIVGAFAKFGKHMESFYDLLASVDKLGALFDLPMETQDGLIKAESRDPAHVELLGVNYRRGGAALVSGGINLELTPGSSLAILGASGSGKSTLMDLLFGLREPTSGRIEIDGFDAQDLRRDVLRDRVALARETEVFHGTIEENIHLQRESITADDVRDALNAVGLQDAVADLDEGWHTELTSKGSPLSENQCRLLCIARAIVGRPGLLLIDSVLDSLADEEVERLLNYLLLPEHSWTLVIATGREAIAERCAKLIDLRRRSGTISS